MAQKCTTNIGGQAVVEGVMMRGQEGFAVSVRQAEGRIGTEYIRYKALGRRHKFFRLPLIRGIVSFLESTYIGVKSLMISSDALLSEAIEEENSDEDESQKEKEKEEKEEKPFWVTVTLVLTMIASIGLSLGLFVVLPSLISSLLDKLISVPWVVNILEGVVRMMIFVGYISLTGLLKDMRRTYEYHGAEHKTINCYESGVELTPENAAKCTRIHRRCGTSFMFIVILITILFFMLIPTRKVLLKVVYRLLLIPVVAALSYELLMFSAKHDNRFVRAMVAPGLLLQKITTREPDMQQLQVAIAAFKAAEAGEIESQEQKCELD